MVVVVVVQGSSKTRVSDT